MTFDELTDGELSLRPHNDDDAPALVAEIGNPRVSQNLDDRVPYPYTLEDARQFLALSRALAGGANLAIVAEGRLVGGIGYYPQSGVFRRAADMGYWLGEAYWGRGWMTRVVRLFCPWVFGTTGLERLEARVFASNAASRRVLEKAGFRHEGTLVRAAVKRGETHDVCVYGLLRRRSVDAEPQV